MTRWMHPVCGGPHEEVPLEARLRDEYGKVVATADLPLLITTKRKAYLLEHVYVPPEFRGNGYSKVLCEKVIEWVKEHTPVDRIEGTVNENAPKLFEMYLSAGFKDRHNRNFIWERHWRDE